MNERTFSTAQAHRLEDPERLVFMPPDEVIRSLDLKPAMVVADVGAGTGYFALPIASVVGSGGRVYAVDFQTGMLDLLGKKLLQPGAPSNITLVHGSAEHTTLPVTCADIVFMASVWHELDDRAIVLREIARILRPAGRLAILDWRPTFSPPPGPPQDHRIAAATVVETLHVNGWETERSGNVGRFSYLVLARRAGTRSRG